MRLAGNRHTSVARLVSPQLPNVMLTTGVEEQSRQPIIGGKTICRRTSYLALSAQSRLVRYALVSITLCFLTIPIYHMSAGHSRSALHPNISRSFCNITTCLQVAYRRVVVPMTCLTSATQTERGCSTCLRSDDIVSRPLATSLYRYW